MDWKKLALVFSGSFVVSGLSVAAALAPMLSDRPEIIGYWGGIAGGLAGGAMTLVAGWLAWTAAQRQIEAQRAVLALATDEHLKRSVHMLHEIRAAGSRIRDSIKIATSVDPAVWKAARALSSKSVFEECDPLDTDWQSVLDDPDFWRIDLLLADKIRLAQREIEGFNAGRGRGGHALPVASPFPVRTIIGAEALAADTTEIVRLSRAEAKRLALMAHAAAHPTAPPAR